MNLPLKNQFGEIEGLMLYLECFNCSWEGGEVGKVGKVGGVVRLGRWEAGEVGKSGRLVWWEGGRLLVLFKIGKQSEPMISSLISF